MADVLRIKRRLAAGGAGTPSSLANAELAYNEATHTLYYGEGTGGSGGTASSVVPIGGSGAFLPLNGGTLNTTLGGWSSANYGKQLLLTGSTNPALGITDSAGANLIGIANAAGVLRLAGMPAYADATTAPVNLLSLSTAGNTSHTALTLANGANFGSVVAPGGNADLSRHISLYGGNQYGFGVTGSRLNYNSQSAHVFLSGAVDKVTISGTGLVMAAATDITLARDPTTALMAVTKQYVDRGVRQVFGTIALLRANALTALTLVYIEGYAAVGGPGGGAFQYVPTDTTSADNGGTIIVDSAGQRWYRETEGAVTNVQWFGATGNGATNDTNAIQAALNTSLAVHFPALPSGAQAVYLVTTALTMRAGHRLFGDGIGVSVLKANTASQTVLSFISPSYIMGRLYISDLSIQANAAGVTGIAVTLANNLTFSNIEFMGCEGDNIRQDRGYFTLVENCEALPNSVGARKAGRFFFNSTDNADYCFYPTLTNCRTHTGEEVGISVGVVSTACIHFRRVISGVINNFVGERLNLPAANTCDGIWVENDSQGIQIINGVTYGAKNGIILFPGTGPAVAPGYLTVADHAIDAFSVAGVSIGGTPAAVCVDVTVQNCLLTAPQGSATAIVCQDVFRVVVNGNSIDQYQAQGGAGILLSTVIGAQVVGNIMNNLATGIGLAGTTNLNMVIADNVFENCANNLIGDITAGGSGTNRVRDNVGLAVGIVATPAVPASGGTLINISGYDVMVYVSGGTNLNWIVNGFVVGPSTGPFLVAAGGNIAVSYTTPPTWVWGGI